MDLRLLDQERLFKALLDNVYDGVYFTDTERRISYWNAGAERITGYTREEVLGHSCADNILMHIDNEGRSLCRAGCPLAACMKEGANRQARVFLHHRDGHRVPVLVTAAPIYDESGAVIGGVETFQDVTTEMAALKEAETLREQTMLCPLTGVGNRRYTEEVLAKRIGELNRTGGTAGVLFLDVDRFKSVNDTHGHEAGDIVLKMVARTLAGAMRPYDFLGRWGGEEFIVVLPNVAEDELEPIANRLRVLVEQSGCQFDGNTLNVTVSIGATLVHAGEQPADAVRRADELMYASKNAGRNRVTVGM